MIELTLHNILAYLSLRKFKILYICIHVLHRQNKVDLNNSLLLQFDFNIHSLKKLSSLCSHLRPTVLFIICLFLFLFFCKQNIQMSGYYNCWLWRQKFYMSWLADVSSGIDAVGAYPCFSLCLDLYSVMFYAHTCTQFVHRCSMLS